MNFYSNLLILIFVLVLPCVKAVKCPYNSSEIFEDVRKECSTCVVYTCQGIVGGLGCLEDFFRACWNETDAIDFIRSKNESNMDFFNGNVLFMSGCGHEIDGTECLRKRSRKFNEEIVERIHNYNYKHGQIIWYNNALNFHQISFKVVGISAIIWIFVNRLL